MLYEGWQQIRMQKLSGSIPRSRWLRRLVDYRGQCGKSGQLPIEIHRIHEISWNSQVSIGSIMLYIIIYIYILIITMMRSSDSLDPAQPLYTSLPRSRPHLFCMRCFEQGQDTRICRWVHETHQGTLVTDHQEPSLRELQYFKTKYDESVWTSAIFIIFGVHRCIFYNFLLCPFLLRIAILPRSAKICQAVLV